MTKEQLDIATELKCYKTLYLIDCIERYRETLLREYWDKDFLENSVMPPHKKLITKIYDELFSTVKTESYNIDWCNSRDIEKLLEHLYKFCREYRTLLEIDYDSLMK